MIFAILFFSSAAALTFAALGITSVLEWHENRKWAKRFRK